MNFETDKQTLEDLNILGRYKTGSIFSMYEGIVTRGGERILEGMFNAPLTDYQLINNRSSIFSFFKTKEFKFPFTQEEFDSVDQYISKGGGTNPLLNAIDVVRMKVVKIITNTPNYDLLKNRVQLAINFIGRSVSFFNELSAEVGDHPFRKEVEKGIALLDDNELTLLIGREKEELSLINLLKYDRIIRNNKNKKILELLKLLSLIDVYIVVGNTSRRKNLCCAMAYDDAEKLFDITNLRHPRIDKAVGNDFVISKDKNVFFLTGANMAGKSTLMKSFGIAVYMAHMGFPVAADKMDFVVRDGLYTSINVPDDISKGYSHFYAEVLRVKHVAEEVSKAKKLLIIFDELFKGTNVKDAYDATLAVTEALAKKRNCAYMVSTHIIEVGVELGSRCSNVQFAFLPTIMSGTEPSYTYILEQGITADKHGMIIINNEKILETIRGEVE